MIRHLGVLKINITTSQRMKIKYNEIEQVFEINDNLKIKYYGIHLLNAILILNALIWIVKGSQSNNLTENIYGYL